MNFFKRLFKIGEAEANSALNKLEDPIKMTEQGIADLKKDLDKSLKALAEVKALAIRARNEVTQYNETASEYESKALKILTRAQNGELDQAEADRLASEALVKKENAVKQSNLAASNQSKFEGNVSTIDTNIKRIKNTISQYENELKTLKARVKVSQATKTMNKQMAEIDSSDTISMLERMKDKVAEEEALAEAYGEMAEETRSIDEEIDKAAQGNSAEEQVADQLAALKNKLKKD